MAPDNNLRVVEERTSRRRLLTVVGTIGSTALAGCNALSGGGGGGNSASGGDGGEGGGGNSIQTKYWNDWPIESKNNDNVPLEYTAVEGQPLDPITIN